MPRYRMTEVTAADVGNDQADMLSALVENLTKKGVKAELVESIAMNMAGAASSWLDGCSGMENPAELVSNPISTRTTRR